jgi:BNR repeat-like domain
MASTARSPARRCGRAAGWPGLLLAGALLTACGGGGSGEAEPPAGPTGLATVRLSADDELLAGCGPVGATTVFVNAEAEPHVAVSPLNPNRLLATWQQDRTAGGGARALVTALSDDGGLTWRRQALPMSRCGGAAPGTAGDFERASDPWVDIAPDGTLHAMGLAITGGSFSAGSANAMLASRSTDGGLSWSTPAVLQADGASHFNDKNTLTADPTDARRVYAVWDRLAPGGHGPAMLARSTDGGLSWQPARVIHDPAVAGGVSQTIGNRVVVLTDGPERGLLVNVFLQIDRVGGQSTASVRAQRSLDQGSTWQAPVTIALQQSVGTRDPETQAPVRDGAVVPAMAVGPQGRLWVAWQDARFSNGLRDGIALSQSADGGRSWSAPVVVNADRMVAAFTPTLQVRADGLVGLMYHDLRSNTADAATLLADLWLATSRDGLTWTDTALRRGHDLNLAPVVTGGRFLGDYHGLVASGQRFVPVVVLPAAGAANRTDVLAMRVEPVAAGQARPLATYRALPAGAPLSGAAFALAHSQALQQALASRLADRAAAR